MALGALIASIAAAAAAVFAVLADRAWAAVSAQPLAAACFLAATLFLQLRVVHVPEQGTFSFAIVAVIATAVGLGVGPAMVAAACAAALRYAVARNGRPERAIFDASCLALSSAAAGAAYHAARALDQRPDDRFGPSLFAAAAFTLVNLGLLSTAMGLAEGRRPFAVFRERFLWLTPYSLAGGPYAILMLVLWERIGVLGIVAMAIVPAALVTPVGRRTSWSS